MGFPRPKRKGRGRETCRFTTGAIRVLPDRRHVQLPKIGVVRTHESTRKLARRIEQGTARTLTATISCTADRWFVSFAVEVRRADQIPHRPDAVVGMDVGVRHLAVLSTGEVVPNPAPLDGQLRRLGRLNRQLARRHGPRAPDGRSRAPSAGWRQTRARLARAHAQVANVRRDHLHKLTTNLAREYGTVVVEHLNLAGLLRNRSLARRLADASLAELRRQLAYKTAWAGGKLVQAEPFYPSSKTCSGCGHVKAKLALSQRVFDCEVCGLAIDRDLNAAVNLARLVASDDCRREWTGDLNARGGNVSPGLAGLTPVKREAGTRHRPG
jgi:putative transposase